MGSYASKLFSHHSENETKSKTQAPAVPCGSEKLKMCTPPISKRKFAADPRSATVGITRTPIEIARTPPGLTQRVASALPKYLQGKRYLETDFDAATPVTTPVKRIPDPRSPNITEQRTPIVVKSGADYLTPVITVNRAPDMDTPVRCLKGISVADPRSPATDFDRTPILKPRSVEGIATGSEENIYRTVESNICTARLSYCESTTNFSIPEIQAVSEAVPVTDESLSLENRIDLCENSCNSMSSRSSSVSDGSDESSDAEEQVTVIRNPNIFSPWSDALSAWTENNAVETDAEVFEETAKRDESMGKTLDNNISDMINAVIKSSISDTRSDTNNDKIKVWRDSVSPNITEEAGRKISEEIIIEFDDEIVAKPVKDIDAIKMPIKVEEDKSKNQPKKRKPQLQLKSENKPLPDERKVFNSEGKNPIDAAKNRTPLGNRSNNHKQLQLIPGKSPQQLLRNKGLSTRTIHQENTPPHNDRFISKTKSNGTQWDPDTTVII